MSTTIDTTPTDTAPGATQRVAGAGWRIVARRDMAGHLHSVRFGILVGLVVLAGLAAVNAAAGSLRDATEAASSTPSAFLLIFTLSPDRIPSFVDFFSILGPLLGIAFGFDAIVGERSQRTLPRLVSQPIHRDDVIVGKFVAGLATISLVTVVVTAVVVAYGMWRVGRAPDGEELTRIVAVVLVSIVYVGLWLGVSVLASVLTRRAATAALATLALWLVFTLFFPLIAGVAADAVSPVDDNDPVTVVDNARTELRIRRLSPDQLYDEATGVLLNPEQQTTGIVVVRADSRSLPSILGLRESLVLAWWQLFALVALTIVAFVAASVLFLRQEIRA